MFTTLSILHHNVLPNQLLMPAQLLMEDVTTSARPPALAGDAAVDLGTCWMWMDSLV